MKYTRTYMVVAMVVLFGHLQETEYAVAPRDEDEWVPDEECDYPIVMEVVYLDPVAESEEEAPCYDDYGEDE